jgi:hypothetical protein
MIAAVYVVGMRVTYFNGQCARVKFLRIGYLVNVMCGCKAKLVS